ncbi:hypothetical protein AB0N05_15465 [Nocardia sp. NPDC051030]|uniref:hypothetical protein n=1 Tax=Nocardia sp. NPDC051030 TaxID=3155162 RepID=UPI00343FD0C1
MTIDTRTGPQSGKPASKSLWRKLRNVTAKQYAAVWGVFIAIDTGIVAIGAFGVRFGLEAL